MAYGHKESYATCNAKADAHGDLLDSGYIRIYSVGSGVPTNADDAITDQTLLAELTFAATAFGASSNGVITAATITADSDANATGTASFGRTYKTDGTTCVDQGLCGTSASDYVLNSLDIQSGGTVSCSSLTRTQPRS